MGRKPKEISENQNINEENQKSDLMDDFTDDLIKSLNKESGTKIAFNLKNDVDASTNVKRWVSTGSRLLDYIVSNRRDGGLPEGRIIEIFGPPSIGKSHLAIQVARHTQKMGGIVVYIDTENATSVDNLTNLGVDISKRFVYVDEHCTEEIFKIAESTILKAKTMKKDVPVTIIWDSVAASSPKAELTADYDKESMGLQARAISKGMRKITGIIGENNVTFICLNQIRQKLGVMFGDPSCVHPQTIVRIRNNKSFINETTSLKELASRFQIKDFDEPIIMDVSEMGYEIESWDENSQQKVWKLIEAFVVKEGVENHYSLGTLRGTSEHKVLTNSGYVPLKEHPEAVKIEEKMQVVDIMVQDTQNYFAEGFVNHNTTPGGMAIPFHSSVRIKLGAGQFIENKNKEPVGIHTRAKIIKNKVSAPFRECEFDIMFGVGIKEHEQVFDVLREYCDKRENKNEIINGKHITIAGTGAWKSLIVTDPKTGEVNLERKFYKAEFDKVLEDSTCEKYCLDLLEVAMVRRNQMNNIEENYDPDSYEETKELVNHISKADTLDYSSLMG